MCPQVFTHEGKGVHLCGQAIEIKDDVSVDFRGESNS